MKVYEETHRENHIRITVITKSQFEINHDDIQIYI